MGRRLIIIALALVVAVQIVRNAAVAALAPLHPTSAARLWESHPAVEISLALANIGKASRERRSIGSPIFALTDDAAAKSPLSAEPFLIRGVQEQTAGDDEAAERAFVEAQWRDPRSLPAAYFLANHYFRVGDTLHGLQQAAVLARLSPNGLETVAPFIAAYAADPSNWPRMRMLFRSQQGLQDGVLIALSQDPRNAPAILAIADSAHRKPDSAWLPVLVQNMIARGNYREARAIWSTIERVSFADELVFDSAFAAPGPPPPFNWSLTSSTVGLAERQPGGGLHVIFYGTNDGVLASQLVLLHPGHYTLRIQLIRAPVHPEALRWSVRCDQGSEKIASGVVDDVAAKGMTFVVPANCPGQWLELAGRSEDISQQSEVTIAHLNLSIAGSDG